MAGRKQGTRYAALRKAQQVKQERDARRLQRERQVETALADFFEYSERAETIRQQAKVKAAKVLAGAETAAREPEELAAVAVRALIELGETRASVMELTGLNSGQLRDTLGTLSTGAGDADDGATEAGHRGAVRADERRRARPDRDGEIGGVAAGATASQQATAIDVGAASGDVRVA